MKKATCIRDRESGVRRQASGSFFLSPVACCLSPDAIFHFVFPLNYTIYYAGFKKSHIFATNFLYKIMSNLLIISDFKSKL